MLVDLVFELAALGLARLVQTVPVHVVQPAVVEAADPLLLDAPVAEVGGAVRAVQAQQPQPAQLVTEEEELLTHDGDG